MHVENAKVIRLAGANGPGVILRVEQEPCVLSEQRFGTFRSSAWSTFRPGRQIPIRSRLAFDNPSAA